MIKAFLHHLLLLAAVFCWASGVPTSLLREPELKDDCPTYFRNDTLVPCWNLGAKCYCFSIAERHNWEDADRFCRIGGMTLLSLETYEEDLLINSHIKGTTTPEVPIDYYWTSGRYSQEGNNRWEWAIVEPYQPIGYSNWYPGEPSSNEAGSYLYMNYILNNGDWFAQQSLNSYILFVCESIDDVIITTSTAPEITTLESTTSEFTSTTERITTEEATKTTEEATTTTEEATTTTEEATTTTEETTIQETTTTEKATTTEEMTTVYFTTTDSSNLICPTPNGNFEIPGNCTSFYNCTNGVAIVQNCPPGTAFNPVVGVCDYPFNVPGCKLTKEDEKHHRLLSIDSSFQCVDIGNWPHPTRCDYFYTCYGNRTTKNKLSAHLWQCKRDSFYDTRYRACRNSKITDCSDRIKSFHKSLI